MDKDIIIKAERLLKVKDYFTLIERLKKDYDYYLDRANARASELKVPYFIKAQNSNKPFDDKMYCEMDKTIKADSEYAAFKSMAEMMNDYAKKLHDIVVQILETVVDENKSDVLREPAAYPNAVETLRGVRIDLPIKYLDKVYECKETFKSWGFNDDESDSLVFQLAGIVSMKLKEEEQREG